MFKLQPSLAYYLLRAHREGSLPASTDSRHNQTVITTAGSRDQELGGRKLVCIHFIRQHIVHIT